MALMGSDVSEYQLDQLVALGREVCCMTDNDAAGKKGKLMIVGGGRQ